MPTCHREVPAPLRHSKGQLEVGKLKQGTVVASGSVGNEGMKHSVSVLFMCVTAHTMVCMQGSEGSLLPSLHGHWGPDLGLHAYTASTAHWTVSKVAWLPCPYMWRQKV